MKLVVVSSIFVVAVGTLIWVGVSAMGIRELDIEDLFTAKYDGGNVQTGGKVIAVHSPANPLEFTIASRTNSATRIRVQSDATMPDGLKADKDCMVKGKFDADSGVFKAYSVVTNCPSRYEASKQYKKGASSKRDAAQPAGPPALLPAAETGAGE